MKSSRFATASALSSAVFFSLVAFPGMAQAQTANAAANAQAPADQPAPTPTTAEPAAQGQELVVTGSRIRRPNLDSPVPVTSVTGQAFFETGRTSVGDVLNDLPALRSTFSQSNSTRFLGTSGLNLLDLRGLGTQRTLVLVNGRRHVSGDILNTAASVDTNTIPTDLIERVDVLTGGSSAVYGSDALAGVVNFVLKDHYEGLEARAQGGVSTYGDAGSYYASVLAGKNFADGRGNIAVNFEYAHQSDFYASDRKYTSQNDTWITVDSDPAGTPNGSDGKPDRQFYTDVRSGTYTNAGTLQICCRAGGGFGIAYQNYIFQPDGSLTKQTGTTLPSLSYRPSFQGGNGDNFRDGTQFALQPRLDRYSANMIGHFDLSRAAVLFVEGTYSRTDSFGSASGPFFTSASGSPREVFHTDNPYLTQQALGIIRSADTYDANCAYTTYGDGIPDADQCGFSIYKNAVDLTNRTEKARRETYRALVGLRGDFHNNWHYEVSANYGEFKEMTEIRGNVNLQRYLLSIDAVDQGLVQNGVANGNIVCRSKIVPSARVAYEGAGDPALAAAQLAADVAACVPVNLFGSGKVTQAARDYILQNSFAEGRITQFVINGFVSGDTAGFFRLPGGPVGFSVGGEYRRETAFYQQDDVTAAALTFYNAIPKFDPPSFEVKEAFAEIRLPLLKDMPFFHELTASGAVRVADYKGATGTVYAYNGGLEWAPVRQLRLRGNYARAVRAPNLSDLYTPLGQNYDTVYDPCDNQHIGIGPNRAANCHADGVPAVYNFEYTSSIGYLSGGNPDLKAETSNSYTVGGVFQPDFAPILRGLSFSADYYHIEVNNVITSPATQAVLNACYDQVSINNQFCALFSRYTGTAPGPSGEDKGQILNNSLHLIPLNYAQLKVSGIDFDIGYEHQIGKLGRLSIHGVYTRALENYSYLDPTNPTRADQTLGELGDPKNAFNIESSFKTGPVTFGYKFRYIGRMVPGTWEDAHSVQGRPPVNADAYPIEFYDPVTYHDIRLGVAVNTKYNFYLGVDNLLNKRPPFGLTGAGAGSGIYNNLGRFLYAGFVAKF